MTNPIFKESGSRGGLKTLQTRGREHYIEMGRRSGASRRKKLSTKANEQPLDKSIEQGYTGINSGVMEKQA